MRLVRVALSALGGVVLAASSALAADIAAVPPPPLWGFYFGGGVCYDWADFDIDKTEDKTIRFKKYTTYPPYYKIIEKNFSHTKNFEGDASDWCGTVTVGYDYQIDQLFLVGIFASYDWQKKNGDIDKIPKYGDPYPVPYSSVWLGNIATVAGRAGVLVQPDLLAYFLIGYSWSEGGIELYGKTLSGNLSGPTVGLGLEKLFTPNWSARLELRHTDFGSLSKSKSYGNYWYSVTKTTNAHITDTSVRVVLTYRP
jgi:opacity protein-like surface antigen